MARAFGEYMAVYLLPYPEDPTALPEKGSNGMFRHEVKIRGTGESDIVMQILSKGGTVISVKKASTPPQWLYSVPREYKRQLLQAITFSVRGGMSAGRAFQAVVESEAGPLRSKLDPGLAVIQAGGTCYDAIKATGLYDETTLAILESGELTGNITDALDTAAKHQDGRAAEQKIMFGAVSWTLMDILFSVGGIVGNITGLLPQAEGSMSNVPPEAAERIEQAIHTAYLVNYALLAGTFVMLAVFVYCLAGSLSKNAKWRASADRIMHGIPFFSDAVSQSAIASSCTVAQSLVRGGVSLIPVSEIAARSTLNYSVRSFWEQVMVKLQQGESIARCFATTNLFTHAERILLVSHSSREQLADTFKVITDQRRVRAEAAAKRFSAFAFFGSLIYSSIAVVVTLWVSYLQYTAMMASNNSLGG